MPSTVTHAFFGKELYSKINKDLKIKIDEKQLMMFCQSMDSLMFYNIISILPGKKIRKLAETFHQNNVNIFFNELITSIKKNNSYNSPDTLAFLYGLISHYCLDSCAHPYIFYKSGSFDKKDKNTYKYNGYHTHMELYIDNYYLKINKYILKSFKNFCFSKNKFSDELKYEIDNAFYKTFNISNMSNKYYKSLNQMCFFIDTFRIDKYGIKKKFYKFIDLFTPKNIFKFNTLSYKQDNLENYNYLNKNNKKWYYSTDKNISSNESFEEIYNRALNKTTKIINAVNSYFYEDKNIDINNLFKNYNYATGKDCNEKLIHKYFEY